ncbi:hypothetical protein QUA40_09630 [Microcoleus sp. Pol11C3]|uniref:hypothetical protein n=1 Tax=Microcoleus sp. Pol11C3 TaxID=3055390 RepID=UPI002FD6F78A
MGVKKPGLYVEDGKKSCNGNRRSNGVKLSRSNPYTALQPIGGLKGGVFSESDVTLKISTANFTKKS